MFALKSIWSGIQEEFIFNNFLGELGNSTTLHCVKVSEYGVFTGPYFPAYGLNKKRYEVSHRIQSKCGKIRTRKISVFGHISNSVIVSYKWETLYLLPRTLQRTQLNKTEIIKGKW